MNVAKKFSAILWPWAYFTNGPDAATLLAPSSLRQVTNGA